MRTTFTQDTVIIQPQAKACMEKEHVSFDEVLETLNEWESGDVQCSNSAEMMRITEYPETEDNEHILTFCDMEKDKTVQIAGSVLPTLPHFRSIKAKPELCFSPI